MIFSTSRPALAVLASCCTQHIDVPDDLALIGADDLPVSSLALPALTTIGMDLTAAAGNLTAGILSTVGATTLQRRADQARATSLPSFSARRR
ncbi:substrate-binding domain-containing protein, partial [Micrococcus luteus]